MSDKKSGRLVVHLLDDDAAVRDSTELLLQCVGIDARTYASAAEFLRDAKLDEVRFLVIDVNMPGIDGMDLLERLRHAGITAPSIFITGLARMGDLSAAAARTGASILLKPYEPGELIARIKRALDES
jgi:two-component system, LuxR family, response regulator FixJ